MAPAIRRRDALRAGLAALTAPIGLGLTPPTARSVRSFRLIEPAGLRRFGYPVSTIVPDAGDGLHFRLLRDGQAIPAQFRRVEGAGGRAEVALDFVASPAPLETSRYEVHFGLEVEPGPEPVAGLTVEKRDGRFFVSQGSRMIYEIAEDLAGLLRSVGSPRLGYLREAGGGLAILEKSTAPTATPRALDPGSGGMHSRVTREGPFAVGLRFEGSSPSGIRSTVDLTIPHSKSWVQAAWTVEDPKRLVGSLGFHIPLLLEGPPILVDLGAGSTVYGQIKGTQRMELDAGRAGREWSVRQGDGENPPVLAAQSPESPRPAEGWAHVMDSRRCTALAVADFGRVGAKDRISAAADGALRVRRDYASDPGERTHTTKSLAFWLHFVPMPVQIGAATSPQAILSPLRVDWDRPPA